MAPHGDDDGQYHPKDAVTDALKTTALTGGVGLFIAALRNTLAPERRSALSVFTHGGKTISTYAFVGGAYEFTKQASANLRETDDWYNDTAGGFAGGAILGLRTGRIASVIGYGALVSVVMSAFAFTGSSLAGRKTDPSIDEYERKEALRLNRRRPIEETLAELGEGRSIRPPGYEERRRERLKEKYGIEIKTLSADPNDN